MKRECRSCEMFEVFAVPRPDRGHCRRYAPRTREPEPEDDEKDAIYMWPLVWADDWCGEYVDRGPNPNLDIEISELELSARSYNCLNRAGNIETVGDLVLKTEWSLLKLKNFGRRSLDEVKVELGSMGLMLGMRFDEDGRLIPPPEARP